MIKTLYDSDTIVNLFKGVSFYIEDKETKYTVPEIVGKILKNPYSYGGKDMFNNLFANIGINLEKEVLDLYLCIYFYEQEILPILDGKNKYATFLLKSKTIDMENPLYGILKSTCHMLDKYHPLNINKFMAYIEKNESDKKIFIKNMSKIYFLNNFQKPIDLLLSYKPFNKILKEHYTIDIFKLLAKTSLDMSLLGFFIKIMDVFGVRDKDIINNFSNVKSGNLQVVGNSNRFNYFWKILVYEPSDKVAIVIAETINKMKTDGSPEYVNNIDKLNKWIIKNPDYSHHFENLNTVVDDTNFFSEPTDSISFHLYVDSVQKLSKKNKFQMLKPEIYQSLIHRELKLCSEISFLKNYIGTIVSEENKDKTITITFSYVDDVNLKIGRKEINKLYEDVIIDLVDNNFSLDVLKLNIKVEDYILRCLTPESSGIKSKAFKI